MKRVWVAVEISGAYAMVASTSLKQLCVETGLPYRSMRKRAKETNDNFLAIVKNKHWIVGRPEVKKIQGRGSEIPKIG